MKLIDILEAGNIALGVLQARLITILALIGAFALFAWAMWQLTLLSAMIACAWGLIVFLPVLFHDRGATHGVSQTEEQPNRAASGSGRSPSQEPDGS